MVALFPYIEETQVHREYNYKVAWSNNKNRDIIQTPIKLLLCPSTPIADRVVVINNTANPVTAATSDYVVIENVANVFYNRIRPNSTRW